jgi:CheY-like chemotaxis protein
VDGFPPDQQGPPSIQHWLVSVAVAACLPKADQLDVASDSDVDAAWDLVAMTAEISAEDLALSVATHYRLDLANLESVDPNAHRLVPGRLARKLNVLPLRYSDRMLTVATADPVSMDAERKLVQVAGRFVNFEIAPPAALRGAIDAAYVAEEPHELPPLHADAKGGAHILVVDDDEDARLLLRTVLEESGFRISEAEDGPGALELLEGADVFDLVTLDLDMPEMPGLEVLQTIRSWIKTASLPVVVATAAHDPEAEIALFEAGADDFVVKPVDPPRFVLRIQAVLRRRSSTPV